MVVFTKNDSLILFGGDNATKIIKKTPENVTGMKPQITFVSSIDGKLIPHDCFAITNYRLLRSGDSFLYFDTSGKRITNGGALDVDSLAKHETYTYVESLLNKLQNTYNEVNRRTKDMIYGNLESKFLQLK